MQLQSALDRFLLQLEADGRSPHTVGQYRRHIRLLIDWLSREDQTGELEDVTDEDLAKFLASSTVRKTAAGTPRKASSANALRSSVKGFFSWMSMAGMVTSDPSRLIRRAITGPAPPRALQAAEEERLLSVLRKAKGSEAERDYMLVKLMLASGIRLSSALALDMADVDLAESTLLLRKVKGDRVERVLLGQGISEVLATYLKGRTNGPVFARRDGARISARHFQRRFRALKEKAGIPGEVAPHSLRHSFAMALYRKSGDVLLVKRALGHASINSTMVYARPSEAALREALTPSVR